MSPFFWPLDRDPLILTCTFGPKVENFDQRRLIQLILYCYYKRRVANQQRTIVLIQFVRRLLGKFYLLVDGSQHHSISIDYHRRCHNVSMYREEDVLHSRRMEKHTLSCHPTQYWTGSIFIAIYETT